MSIKAKLAEQRPGVEDRNSTGRTDSILAQATTSKGRARSLQKKRTILIVDDNRYIRQLLSRLLEMEDFSVTTARHGREGIDLAIVETPDCMLIDINLPHISGIDVIKVLRREPKLQRTPIIAITAYGHWAAAQAMQSGADLAMIKPVEPDELIENINRLLDVKRDK
jgi:two-component system, cell cycle response regulator DivK